MCMFHSEGVVQHRRWRGLPRHRLAAWSNLYIKRLKNLVFNTLHKNPILIPGKSYQTDAYYILVWELVTNGFQETVNFQQYYSLFRSTVFHTKPLNWIVMKETLKWLAIKKKTESKWTKLLGRNMFHEVFLETCVVNNEVKYKLLVVYIRILNAPNTNPK